MKNPYLDFCPETLVHHIKKGASISVRKRNDSSWDHAQHTTRDLHFDLREIVINQDNKMNITFQRKFNGETWFLKINKDV